ncbi:MAG TPA: NAD(P)-dependent alcohol dehydrogenase [Jiangellaceae bacterium]
MKAVVRDTYGSPDVIEFRDMPKPEPGDDDVLIRVHTASVNPYDWHYLTGTPYMLRLMAGVRRPRVPVLGADVAGVVEAVGSQVGGFAPGDRVFGIARGSFAEWTLTRPQSIAAIPDGVGFDVAAALPIAGLTALQAVRDHAAVESGQSVLVIGAGGGVGMYAVQLAVARGAAVTGVCSTRNVEVVKSLGAERVIDYTGEDFAAVGQKWDVIVDAVGDRSFTDVHRSLTPEGVYVMLSGPKSGKLIGPLRRTLARRARFLFSSQRFANFIAATSPDDLAELGALAESGRVRSVIDTRHPLADTASAIRKIGTGHARAKTVVDVIEG